MLIIINRNESGDKSNIIYNWGPQKSRFIKKEVREAADSQKRVCEAKRLGTSGLTYRATVFSQLAIQHIVVFS